jgi:hypothetical protein
MDCPVCDEYFSNDSELQIHLEKHVKQSVLNKPAQPDTTHSNYVEKSTISVNLSEFFGKNKFEKMASSKMEQITDIEELVQRRNFVEEVKKIMNKHPFVYPKYFIKEIFEGEEVKKIMNTFHILYYIDLQLILQKTLNFQNTRYTKKSFHAALIMNLGIPTWKEKYGIFLDNCKFFNDELLELLFYNVLRSFIILRMTDFVNEGIRYENIVLESKKLKDNYDMFHFVDIYLKNEFEQFYDIGFNQIVKNILNELLDSKIIRKYGNDLSSYVGRLSIDKIKEKIIDELRYNAGTCGGSILRTNVVKKFPSIGLIPGLSIWETAINELDKECILHRSMNKSSSIFFLSNDYQKIKQNLELFDTLNTKFFGRKISPDDFVMELKELEKGDFGDQDDQVTRIAGLILSESIKLQAPHETIPEFDFSTDLTNYRFRPEQVEVLSSLNFSIESNIFHCKVMLEEKLTFEKFEELKNILPDNEQGIIFTFMPISEKIIHLIEHDKKIQIINKEGLKKWVSITTQIPARINSISKITFDPLSKLENKIVKVNSVFYETGIALVNVFPEMNEVTVLVRTLEEIPLFTNGAHNFIEFANDYSDFLTSLFTTATYDDVIEGIFKNKFNDISPLDYFKLEFDYNVSELNLSKSTKREIFHCNCMKYAENNLKFCSHLVSALDYIFRYSSKQNILRDVLEIWIKENILIILDRLEIDDENYVNEKVSHFVSGKFKIIKDL